MLLLQNLTRFVWIFSVSNDSITIETIIIVGCVCGFVVVCLTFILCILCWRRHVATSEIFYSTLIATPVFINIKDFHLISCSSVILGSFSIETFNCWDRIGCTRMGRAIICKFHMDRVLGFTGQTYPFFWFDKFSSGSYIIYIKP